MWGVSYLSQELGHGISNTEAIFILDKWAECAEQAGSIIPSKIQKGKHTTHIFDNFDYKNKNKMGIESHHTNSNSIKKIDIRSYQSINLDYSFVHKDHRS